MPDTNEAALRERETMLQNLANNLPNGATFRFIRRDAEDFYFQYISDGIERLTGLSSARILANPRAFFDLIVEKDRDRVAELGEAAQKEMKQFDCQARVRTPGSEIKWLHWRSLPHRLPSGEIAWDGLVVDITPLKFAESELWRLNEDLEATVRERSQALAESERRHRTLLTNLPGAAYRCRNDQPRTMEIISEGCRMLFGVSPEAFTTGQITYESIIHPEDRERVWNDMQEAIVNKIPFTFEYRVRHAGGKWRHVWEQGRAIFDAQERVIALEGFITDVTDRVNAEKSRRSLEDQLRQAQKLEAIGTLAGGIAHDFNNILAAIMGSAELIKMDITRDHPSFEFLQQILVAGGRARGLVQQILTFSKRMDTARSVISLQPVVQECLHLLRSTIPAMVEINSQIDSGCAPVLADPTQIHQVIVNLCTNAWHALPEHNGRIEVKLEPSEVDDLLASTHPDLCTGSHVRLSIRDNGCGMDKATLERIFEPFFSTKPSSKGTGLGLSVVHGILKAHKAAILVESEPNQGSLFSIYFRAEKAPADAPSVQTDGNFHGHGERILLVDDEELPGRTVEKIISRLGYQVKRFTHPEQALTDFRTSPNKYDVVVSDLAMPGMSGNDLAIAMLKIRSNIPILIITGLADPSTQEKARQAGVRNVLFKPLTTKILGREIAQLLNVQTEI